MDWNVVKIYEWFEILVHNITLLILLASGFQKFLILFRHEAVGLIHHYSEKPIDTAVIVTLAHDAIAIIELKTDKCFINITRAKNKTVRQDSNEIEKYVLKPFKLEAMYMCSVNGIIIASICFCLS